MRTFRLLKQLQTGIENSKDKSVNKEDRIVNVPSPFNFPRTVALLLVNTAKKTAGVNKTKRRARPFYEKAKRPSKGFKRV